MLLGLNPETFGTRAAARCALDSPVSSSRSRYIRTAWVEERERVESGRSRAPRSAESEEARVLLRRVLERERANEFTRLRTAAGCLASRVASQLSIIVSVVGAAGCSGRCGACRAAPAARWPSRSGTTASTVRPRSSPFACSQRTAPAISSTRPMRPPVRAPQRYRDGLDHRRHRVHRHDLRPEQLRDRRRPPQSGHLLPHRPLLLRAVLRRRELRDPHPRPGRRLRRAIGPIGAIVSSALAATVLNNEGTWTTAAFLFGAIPCVLSGLAVLLARKHPHVVDPVHDCRGRGSRCWGWREGAR